MASYRTPEDKVSSFAIPGPAAGLGVLVASLLRHGAEVSEEPPTERLHAPGTPELHFVYRGVEFHVSLKKEPGQKVHIFSYRSSETSDLVADSVRGWFSEPSMSAPKIGLQYIVNIFFGHPKPEPIRRYVDDRGRLTAFDVDDLQVNAKQLKEILQSHGAQVLMHRGVWNYLRNDSRRMRFELSGHELEVIDWAFTADGWQLSPVGPDIPHDLLEEILSWVMTYEAPKRVFFGLERVFRSTKS